MTVTTKTCPSTSVDGVFGCRRAIARLALPSTANCIAPTGNAKQLVKTQPFTSVLAPSSASVFAPVLVCASVRKASAGYINSCAAALLAPPATSVCVVVSGAACCLFLLRSALVVVAARHSVQSVRIVARLPINQGEPALLTTACIPEAAAAIAACCQLQVLADGLLLLESNGKCERVSRPVEKQCKTRLLLPRAHRCARLSARAESSECLRPRVTVDACAGFTRR